MDVARGGVVALSDRHAVRPGGRSAQRRRGRAAVRAEGARPRRGAAADRGRRRAGRAQPAVRRRRRCALAARVLAGTADASSCRRARGAGARRRSAARQTVGVRVPADAVARALAARVGLLRHGDEREPSAAAGRPTADDVARDARRSHRLLIDAGPTRGGAPSTIVDARARRSGARARRGDRVGPRAKIAAVMRQSASRAGTHERRERAALVGLFNGASAAVRSRTFARRARRPGRGRRRRRSCCACCRSARSPIPPRFSAAARSQTLAAACAETDVDVVIFDNELTPGAAAQPRGGARPQGRRSHAAHSRHLRAARAHARRQAAGRARAAEVPAAAAGRVASDALSRLGGGIGTRGPGETKLETDRRRIRHRISDPVEGHRHGAPAAGAAARAAAQGRGADRRARRLHQRRQDDALQRADAAPTRSRRTRCS